MGSLATLIGCAKLILLLAACYVAGAALFARRNERNSIGLAVIWFVAGFCLVSFFFLLAKVAGSPAVFFVLLPALIVALLAIRKPELRTGAGDRPGELAWALAFSGLSAVPVLIMGIRMGAGEFPVEFFSADSPYFLHQVYALMRTDAYPPPSLELYGLSFRYHYGIQAFAALASLLTGLKPHFLLFAAVEPLLEILAGLLVYDISRRLTGSHRAALACLVLILLGSKQYLVNYFSPAGWDFVTRDENFNFRFPNPPNVAGLLVALCAVRCALDFERREMRLAALFFTCMLPVFKIPYLIPISGGLALVYGFELRRQFSLPLLLEIAGAAVLASLCYVTFAMSGSTTQATAGFMVLGFLEMALPWHNETLLILGALCVAAAAVTRQPLSEGLLRLLIIALSPYLLFSLCDFEVGNQYQIFDLAIKLVMLFTSAYMVSAWMNWRRGNPVRYAAAAVVLVALTGPGAVSLLTHIHVVSARPEKGHEYANNRSIADALRHIPLRDTLIVTNDLRYPANDYSRNLKQFQLAGIFGHRNLASNLLYGGLGVEELSMYAGIMQLFQKDPWPGTQVGYVLEKFPVTHLLIHKAYRHAHEIPLKLVYENREYAVYRF